MQIHTNAQKTKHRSGYLGEQDPRKPAAAAPAQDTAAQQVQDLGNSLVNGQAKRGSLGSLRQAKRGSLGSLLCSPMYPKQHIWAGQARELGEPAAGQAQQLGELTVLAINGGQAKRGSLRNLQQAKRSSLGSLR